MCKKNYNKGAKVIIFNYTQDGRKFEEGTAIVEKKSTEGEYFWHVKFISDGYRCVRNLREAILIKEK